MAAPMLVLCVAGYWIELQPDAVRRFEMLSALVFACVGWLTFAALRPPPGSSDPSRPRPEGQPAG
jgi:hypothetical protein